MKPDRLASLDAFRGFTIASMILVNDPGSWNHIYKQLDHAEWNGWTFTDFVFPFFLWIVGVSMTYSFAARMAKGDSRDKLLLGLVRRSAIIFLLGLVYNNFPFFGPGMSWATFRIPGVLQRIALCSLIAGVLYLYTSQKTRILSIGVILASYLIAMLYIPVPNIGAGLLEPGKNLAAYVDSLTLFGHVWKETAPWDPEGLLSSFPAIATALFGGLMGDYLRKSEPSKEEKTGWIFVTGGALLLFGIILNNWMPINKKLWTSSYVVFMAGWAHCIFGVFYFLMDVKQKKTWAKPFVIYGMNAITVYMLSCIFVRIFDRITFQFQGKAINFTDFLFEGLARPLFSPLNASLAVAIGWVLFLYAIAYYMYKKGWFLKV